MMNYPFRGGGSLLFATGELDAEEFDARLSAARMAVPEPVAFAMFNLLSSHDTERFFTLCNGDESATPRLALLFQMTYPGIPMLYYGDEIGMQGGADPDCRRPMIWEEEKTGSGTARLCPEVDSDPEEVCSPAEGRIQNRLPTERRGCMLFCAGIARRAWGWFSTTATGGKNGCWMHLPGKKDRF